MISIGTDIGNLILENTLNKNTIGLNNSIERMTTGYKINRAKDDAAGYSIAEDLESKISSMLIVQQNTEQGISMLETAENALDNMMTLLQRLRDLAEQASNDVYGDDSREAMQAEADEIIEQIEVIRASTNFNGIKLLEGAQSPAGGSGTTTFSIGGGGNVSGLNSIAARANYGVHINTPDTGGTAVSADPKSIDINTVLDSIDDEVAVLSSSMDTTPVRTTTFASPAPLAVDIEGAEDFAANETRTITIDGINYTVTNRQGTSSSLSYMKDSSTGEITFIGNSFTIRGQADVQHNITINGRNNYVYGGDLDDTLQEVSTYSAHTNTGNRFYGGDGDDTISTNGGWVYIYGEGGNDTITSRGAYNSVNAGDGDDIINTYANAERNYSINGGAGNDTFNIYGSSYIFRGGDGDDTFNIHSASYNIINGDSGTNTVTGSVGSNTTVNVVGANANIVDFAGSETKTVNINGIDYTVTNNSTSANSLIYQVNSSTGRIIFRKATTSGMTIRGDANAVHNVQLASAYLTFYGGNNDDTIIISDNQVTVRAGAGDDSISTSGYAYATIYGDAGNDRITISNQNSSRARIFGGDGDDILSLAGYTNYVDMGDGNDTVTATSISRLNSIIGGSGTNTITDSGTTNWINGFGTQDNAQAFTVGANATQSVTINGKSYTVSNSSGYSNTLLYAYNPVNDRTSLAGYFMSITSQSDTEHNLDFYGYASTLRGGNMADDINVYSIQATVYGLGGNDNITIRTGQNSVYGGDGDDNLTLYSGGNISGGNGNDTLNINANNNTYSTAGGNGDDTYNINAACSPSDTGGNNIYNINANNVTVTGSSGNDTFYVQGSNNTVSGAGGDDYFVIDDTGYNLIDGGTGNNFYVDNSNGNAVIINAVSDANSGILYFTYVGEEKTFTINGKTYTVRNETTLAPSQATNQLRYTYNSITGQITTYGSNFTITSDNSVSNLGIRGDNNVVNGSNYDDRIIAETGTNNQINGLGGNDTLINESANNSLIGGAGNDTITLNESSNKEISGGDGNDIINLNSSNNTNINTGAGDDTINGTSSNNVINAGDGDNNVLIDGNGNRITAGDGNNRLSAMGDNNTINSGNGNNTIGVDGSNNTVTDGNGDSTYNIYGEGNTFTASGGGNDVEINGNNNTYNGGSGVDDVSVRGDSNTANGGDSNDTFVVRNGNNNFIDGNNGNYNTLLDRGNNTTYRNVVLLGQNPFQATFKVDIGTTANDYISIAIDCPFAVDVDFSTSDDARNALDDIDDMMDQITEQLANIGAAINRLESVRDYQSIKMNNLVSSLSTIKDADIAVESSNFIRYQILQNATVTLLSATRNLRRENVLGIINGIRG